jgi:hypothetical protein
MDITGLSREGMKETVVKVLREIVERGYEVGGMGEYGKGWNDSQMQMRMVVEEVIRKWQEW